jgi:hypothetical protein
MTLEQVFLAKFFRFFPTHQFESILVKGGKLQEPENKKVKGNFVPGLN